MAEEINQTENVVIKGSIVDVPFKGKYVRFENLSEDQIVCLVAMADVFILSTTRKSALLKF